MGLDCKVGYVGIGVMGAGIVRNLRKAGVAVSFVVHRNRDRVPALVAAGAQESADYASLARWSDVILMTLPDSSVVEPLMLGAEGLGPHLRGGHVVVDMSTSHPTSTRKIAGALEPRGILFLDAPLTGSRGEAESGALNVMCGGPPEAFGRLLPLFRTFALRVFHVGPVGTGHAVKLINNFLGQVSVAAVCEMLPLALKCGVDLQSLFDVVSVSGGNSRAFQGLVPRLMRRDFSVAFKQKYAHKDVRYIASLARDAGVSAPMSLALLAVHDVAAAHGYAESDFSALLKLCEEMSGVQAGEAAP